MHASRVVAVAVWFAVLLFGGTDRAEGDGGDRIVVTVGHQTLRVRDVERRLRALPAFQIDALGSRPDEVRRRFVEQVLVPELLLGEEASRLRLEQDAAVADRTTEVLREAIEEDVGRQLDRERPITDQDVQRYYEANRSRYETPRRIRIWRILVDDEALARRIIGEAAGKDGPQRWTEHARARSVDPTTRMRKGDLGFVWQDG